MPLASFWLLKYAFHHRWSMAFAVAFAELAFASFAFGPTGLEVEEPISVGDLISPLAQAGSRVHVIGGADEAAELDAKRAIDQGTRLAASL